MKRLLSGTMVLMALAAGPAVAADMPVKAPFYKAPRPAVYGWAGCYIGGIGGYARNTGKSFYQDPNTTQDPINGVPGLATGSIPTPTNTNSKGWIGGGEVGCNFQSGLWVYGIEGDFAGGHLSGSQTTVGPPAGYQVSPPLTLGADAATAAEEVSLRWLSTVRGRVGFAVQDRLLVFATGGLAGGSVDSNGSVIVPNSSLVPVWGGSGSTVKIGYSVGGGAELALSDRWSAKADYLWYDLGRVSHALNCISASPTSCTGGTFGSGVYPTLGNAVSSVRGNIIRVGLNYRFN